MKEVKLRFDRETKRCYRFTEDADFDKQTVGTIYVRKGVFDKKPNEITVIIRPEGQND